MRSSRPIAEWLLLAVPVVVAAVQVFLSTTSDLTTWRGGGFGMYSDAHPNQSRNIWLTGEREGEPRAVRVFPLDERIRYGAMRAGPLTRALADVRREARRVRNFPSAASGEGLVEEVRELLEEHGAEPVVAELFPREGFGLTVMEVAITPDFEALRADPLRTIALPETSP